MNTLENINTDDNNVYTVGNNVCRVNEDFLQEGEEVSEEFICNLEDIMSDSCHVLGYGLIKSTILFDYDIGYLGYLNSCVESFTERNKLNRSIEQSNYSYVSKGIFGMKEFDTIANRFLNVIQQFYSTDKKLYMIRNYGVIYSNSKNTATKTHSKSCDIVFNICLHNTLNYKDIHGSICYYTSQPSIFSKYKKNIRLSFHMQPGDIIIHRGSHPIEVFNVNPTTSGSRTNLIIECNFI